MRFFQGAGDILQSEMPFCVGAIAIGLGAKIALKFSSRSADLPKEP
jgi:hypothetical protein